MTAGAPAGCLEALIEYLLRREGKGDVSADGARRFRHSLPCANAAGGTVMQSVVQLFKHTQFLRGLWSGAAAGDEDGGEAPAPKKKGGAKQGAKQKAPEEDAEAKRARELKEKRRQEKAQNRAKGAKRPPLVRSGQRDAS
jgi:hypothetical protein